MAKPNVKFEVNPGSLKDLLYEQFKDTDFETECPNRHRSVIAHIGENVCEFCGRSFPFVIKAKI